MIYDILKKLLRIINYIWYHEYKNLPNVIEYMTMALCKVVVPPLLMHWNYYHSIALSHHQVHTYIFPYIV